MYLNYLLNLENAHKVVSQLQFYTSVKKALITVQYVYSFFGL